MPTLCSLITASSNRTGSPFEQAAKAEWMGSRQGHWVPLYPDGHPCILCDGHPWEFTPCCWLSSHSVLSLCKGKSSCSHQLAPSSSCLSLPPAGIIRVPQSTGLFSIIFISKQGLGRVEQSAHIVTWACNM